MYYHLFTKFTNVELRRAKNDILSTMGIVVSEDTNRGPNDQEKVDKKWRISSA